MKQIKIGFDLGNSSMKIAALRRGGPELYEVPLPEHLMEEDTIAMPHAFSAFLKRIKRSLGLPGGPAGLILPASQVICRLVTLPAMSVDQLLLNLPYEFNDFIHGEPHQYHCDYALCTPDPVPEGEELPDTLTMMAAAVEKQKVREYVRMFSAAGFALRRILPQEMALIQLAKAHRLANPQAPAEFCFLDLGYLSTRVFIIQGDRLQTMRRIPTGCRELDLVVADVLNIDPFLADAYKRGNHLDILSHPRCAEIYEHIAVEALKLVNFYHFTYRQSQLQGIYLLGGGGGIAPLCQVLEETLGLPVLPIQALLPDGVQGEGAPAACAAAVGVSWNDPEEGAQ